MKPFNLEEALAGKPVVTSEGFPVTELRLFETADKDDYPLVGVVDGTPNIFTNNGRFHKSYKHDCDLFMADEKKTVWIGIRKKDLNTTKAKETKEEVYNTLSRNFYGNPDTDWQIIPVEIEV